MHKLYCHFVRLLGRDWQCNVAFFEGATKKPPIGKSRKRSFLPERSEGRAYAKSA